MLPGGKSISVGERGGSRWGRENVPEVYGEGENLMEVDGEERERAASR